MTKLSRKGILRKVAGGENGSLIAMSKARGVAKRAAAAVILVGALLPASVRAVDYANVTVTDGATPYVDPPTVSIPAGQGTVANAGQQTEGFFIDPGSVVGEVPIRIGASASDDAAGGVLIASVAEFGRAVPNPDPSRVDPEILYASASIVLDSHYTSTNTRGTAGGLAIATDRAGSNVETFSNYPEGAPLNANVGAAYFPFSQGWIGGTALNSSDGGAYDQLIQNGGFQLGVNVQQDFFGEGDNRITVPGVQDTRRQGLLLGMTAHNEDNFAVVQATAGGEAYNLTTRSGAQDGGSAESDPVSFVFVPFGTPNLTMASIYGAYGPDGQPVALNHSGDAFTVVKNTDVNGPSNSFRLSIPGQSPTSGVLLLQSGGNQDGDSGLPADNLITYYADGSDWIITSDDLPNANGAGQGGDSNGREQYFQFVFMPFNTPATAPGAIPTLNWTKKSVIGANVDIIELIANDNNNDDGTIGMWGNVTAATPGINALNLRSNYGDNSVSFDGALPVLSDGVMFATLSEGLITHGATGVEEFGTIGVSLTGDTGSWEVHTGRADPGGGESNIDFSVVLFGANSGFQMAAQQATDTAGHLDVTLSGVNSLTDGVLIANNYGNDYQFVTVEPKSDGSGWDLDNYTDGAALTSGDVNWIYLPYDTENLVAGRVNEDGSLVNSTDTAQFTLTRETDGKYLLTIDGRTPDDGMLLLSATGPNGSQDNQMAYEVAGNSFRILGIDMITSAEEGLGEFTDHEDTSFSFAFIDYLTPPVALGGALLEADFNQDGSVDATDLAAWQSGYGTGSTKAAGDADGDGAVSGADFLTWQQQFGQSAAAASSSPVPEPATAGLAIVAAVATLAGLRRRS